MVLEMSRHHAQLNRVSVLTSLRENRVLMGDPESDSRRPRESAVDERETKSGSTSSMAKKAMNGWRPKRNGYESTT